MKISWYKLLLGLVMGAAALWVVSMATGILLLFQLFNRAPKVSERMNIVKKFGHYLNAEGGMKKLQGASAKFDATGGQESAPEHWTPSPRVDSYLLRRDLEADAARIRLQIGGDGSPALMALLLANRSGHAPEVADFQAAQDALQYMRSNPRASLEELKGVMRRLDSVPLAGGERQTLLEVANQLNVPDPTEHERTIREMEEIVKNPRSP